MKKPVESTKLKNSIAKTKKQVKLIIHQDQQMRQNKIEWDDELALECNNSSAKPSKALAP